MPDARVQSAVEHWAPRFIQAGVDYNDFVRTTARVERWEDWLDVWCETAEAHAELAREAEAAARGPTAGEAWLRAAVCFHFAKFVWVLDAGRARAAADQAVAALLAAHRWLDPGAERIEAPLAIGNLRRPPGSARPPLVLLIPGLDSTKEELRSTEQTFLDRGLATFSVDGPGQGEAEYDVKIRGDWGPVAEVLYDAIGREPDLDRDRLGVWGVSLGGYYSVRVMAALGDRASAGVALAGPFSFGECWDGLPSLTRDTFRVRSGTADDDEARAVAATLELAQVAGDVTAPMLLVFGKKDRLIPYQQAEKVHATVPGSELLMLEEANHGCADQAPWHRPRTADWLAHHLGGNAEDPATSSAARVKAGV